MPLLKIRSFWLKKIKVFLFIKNKLSCRVNFFNKAGAYLSCSSYFNVFMLKVNNNVLSRPCQLAVFKKLNFIGISVGKTHLKKNNTYRTIYAMYKIFLKNGFFLKVVKSLNKSFKTFNQDFYNKNFYNYFNRNFLFVNKGVPSSSYDTEQSPHYSESYCFKHFFLFFKDLVLINDINHLGIGGLTSFNENAAFFNSDDDDQSVDLTELQAELNKSKSETLLNIFFKYFFFFNVNSAHAQINSFRPGAFLNSYFYGNSNVCHKQLSISFFSKYFFMLFHNVSKKIKIEYSKLLNNFVSILFFIPKLIRLITFFFKVQAVSLSKRVRKSLKNKYRHAIVYKYVKPARRLKTSISFLKSFLLLVEGQGLDKKVSNMLSSVLLEKNNSFIVKLKNIQQFECFKHMRFEKS